MADHPWMQAEEHAFIENPWAALGPRALAARRNIQQRVGLDYFGIDCGLTPDGRVVLFEVHASMLVHLRNEKFPYKNPAVLRIKSAFARSCNKRLPNSPLPAGDHPGERPSLPDSSRSRA